MYVDEGKNYSVDNETRKEAVATTLEITSWKCSGTY